jgi:hypothetical protein
MKIRSKILALLIMLSVFTSVMPVHAIDTVNATSEIPYTEASGIFNSAYTSTVTAYDKAGAAEAGVPAGYSGYVLRAQPNKDPGYAAVELDFSSQNIPIGNIESITFKVFLPTGHKQMRLLAEKAPSTWVMQVNCQMGAWCDIRLDVDGANFNSGMSLASLANADGNLGRMCLIGRMGSSSDASFYLDSVRIQYKPGVSNDRTPPVITYNGATHFEAYEGEEFSVSGVSAFDEYDNDNATITYEWSSGAINGAGRLQLGSHTCTVRATDRSGNSSTITLTVNVKVNQSLINLDSIPYTSYIEGVSIYDGTVENLSSDEAAAKGVPTGYSGNVLKVSSSNPRFGMTFDPTGLNIPIGLIEYITVRVYMNQSTNAFRLNNHGADEWIALSNLTAGVWSEYTISADGKGFSNGYRMDSLADENGNLGIFGIATKYEAKDYVFYIDSITIKLKDDDSAAPIINYSGKTDILTSAGKVFAPGITAFDELEEREVALVYDWSEGAIDADGKMLEGEHTCRVSATDYYGNTSYLDLNVTVGPPDVEAPEIQFFAEEIFVPVGTLYRMTPYATDNYDDVEVVESWSEGAVDPVGRLSEGVHTLTLTATDLSGNSTEKVITVYVVSTDSTVGTLIDCGK